MFSIFSNCTDPVPEDSSAASRRVFINVYDMVQPSLITSVGYFALGVGIYHSGLELDDREYCFGGHERIDETGVFVMEPRVGPPNVLYKRSIDMGCTAYTEEEIQDILITLSKDFVGPSYSLLKRNCNHFSSKLCLLLTGRPVPSWINRAAHLGTFFPCIITDDLVQPPDFDDSSEEENDVHHDHSNVRNNQDHYADDYSYDNDDNDNDTNNNKNSRHIDNENEDYNDVCPTTSLLHNDKLNWTTGKSVRNIHASGIWSSKKSLSPSPIIPYQDQDQNQSQNQDHNQNKDQDQDQGQGKDQDQGQDHGNNNDKRQIMKRSKYSLFRYKSNSKDN
ncbi:PPPDE putative peptidase domain-containing protein [Phycomyces blakesleeanus]